VAGKSLPELQGEMYWFKIELSFESLHSDPRWQVMLDKVGFPE